MNDLVQRLRDGSPTISECEGAADEIERLQAENKELREYLSAENQRVMRYRAALEKIADESYADDDSLRGIAREALGETE